MNREGAETYLRLLGEAELRGSLTAATQRLWAGGPGISGGGRAKLIVVGQALIAVGALDAQTAEDIVADFDLAVSVRLLHEQTSQGPGPAGAGRSRRHAPSRNAAIRHAASRSSPSRSSMPGRCELRRWPAGPPRPSSAAPDRRPGRARLARAWPAGSGGSLDPANPKDLPRAPRSWPGSGRIGAESTGSSRSG